MDEKLKGVLEALIELWEAREPLDPDHPILDAWRRLLDGLPDEPMNPEIRAVLTVGKNWDKGKVFIGGDGAAKAASYNEYWGVTTGTYVDDISLERPNGNPKDWKTKLPARA